MKMGKSILKFVCQMVAVHYFSNNAKTADILEAMKRFLFPDSKFKRHVIFSRKLSTKNNRQV